MINCKSGHKQVENLWHWFPKNENVEVGERIDEKLHDYIPKKNGGRAITIDGCWSIILHSSALGVRSIELTSLERLQYSVVEGNK